MATADALEPKTEFNGLGGLRTYIGLVPGRPGTSRLPTSGLSFPPSWGRSFEAAAIGYWPN